MADGRRWGDSGILRGKKPEEDDLLVFGYSCKLFRDDEKALFIDQGKHLIPWMGDESLKIDRYDGRAAIPDLRKFEAGGANDFEFVAGLSEAERRVETLCDEERYRALHHAEDDEELYHEEELKRLQQALAGQQKQYGAVQYAYDEEHQCTVQVDKDEAKDDEDDSPFVAPPELDIPLNMVLPTSNKLHAIIERTSAFIAKQGGQMEVLLKAKQSGNSQFGFLSFDNSLHPYYKLLLGAIKAGRYKPREPPSTADEEGEGDEEEEDDNGDHYLHPSLAVSTKIDLAPAIPSITYRPSANCAYSMLVSKIKGSHVPTQSEQQGYSESNPMPPMLSIHCPVIEPPPDEKIVIQKMAGYVAKNGPDFEAVVRGKGDPRFSFLDPTHPFYGYYREQLRELTAKQALVKPDVKSVPAPVSFSIRPQTADGVLETRSALEEGSERPRAGEAYMATALQRVSDVPLPPCPPPEPEVLDKEELERRNAAAQRSKIAEERLRAKLLAAARERVASASKEKQVQQERKRKVAAFLSKLALEKRQIVKPEEPVMIGPQLPPELRPPPDSDDHDDVKSIPSPSPPHTPSPPLLPVMDISTTPPPPPIGWGEPGSTEQSPVIHKSPLPPILTQLPRSFLPRPFPNVAPLIKRRLSSPRPNGDRKRRSPSSSSSSHRHRHKRKRSSSPKHHRRQRSRSRSSSKKRHHRSPTSHKSHKKKVRQSPSPRQKERRRTRSSSSESVKTLSSSSTP